MLEADFKPGFLRTLLVLRPYLPEIVIGGGWVPLIYYHYLINDKTMEPMLTKDIDLMVPASVPVVGQKTIDALLIDAGLNTDFGGPGNPPADYYEGQIDGQDVEIQFLTHKVGPGANNAIAVQKGLNAQELRYISVLLDNPMEIEIDDPLLLQGSPLTVRVPKPGAYIFNKSLVFPRRAGELKKAKDLYHIFDILANCPQLRDQIVDQILALKGQCPQRWFRDFKRNLRDQFIEITSDGVDLVAGQRPSGAFPDLNDDQLKYFVLGTFQEFLDAF